MQQLILLKYVEAVGRPGGTVRVRDGFANNYLLPKGLAVPASRENMRRLESLRQSFVIEEKARAEHAKALVEQIATTSITLTMKASEEGHLYGSVSPTMIVDSLKEQGIEMEARAVRLTDPIKEIGRYEVPLHVHEEHTCELKVWVVEEKEVVAEVEAAAEAETVDAGAEVDAGATEAPAADAEPTA